MLTNIRHFYLDNNFFSLLAKDHTGKKIENWNRSIEKLGVDPNGIQVHFLATPFLFLEAIGSPQKGLTIPNIKIPDELISKNEIEAIKKYLYDSAYAFFSKQPKLQPAYIIQLVEEQKKFVSPFGLTLFNEILAHNSTNPNFEVTIWQYLSLDFVQKYEYPEGINGSAMDSFTIDILRSTAHGWNLSLARLIPKRWKQISPFLVEKGELKESDLETVTSKEYCFKWSSDLVDTEITHFATVGWLDKQKLNQVACFTTDPAEKLEFRAGVYRSLSDEVYADALEKKAQGVQIPFEIFKPENGVICRCDNTGNITDVINVKSIERIRIE